VLAEPQIVIAGKVKVTAFTLHQPAPRALGYALTATNGVVFSTGRKSPVDALLPAHAVAAL